MSSHVCVYAFVNEYARLLCISYSCVYCRYACPLSLAVCVVASESSLLFAVDALCLCLASLKHQLKVDP